MAREGELNGALVLARLIASLPPEKKQYVLSLSAEEFWEMLEQHRNRVAADRERREDV